MITFLRKRKLSSQSIETQDTKEKIYGRDQRVFVPAYLHQLSDAEMKDLEGNEIKVTHIGRTDIVKDERDLMLRLSSERNLTGKLLGKSFTKIDGYTFAWQYVGKCPIHSILRVLPIDAEKIALEFSHGKMFKVSVNHYLIDHGDLMDHHPKGHPYSCNILNNYENLAYQLKDTISY
ncbi:hypothetical protein J4408_02900 [Candidatus Pacearchaeota archaeon]|nr:hypothetical protein [Candidatus Pacearchaeota archaeon]